MTRYVIPALYRPTPPQQHPAVDVIGEQSMRWMRSLGFGTGPEIERWIANIEPASLATHMFPEQPVERIQWFSDYWCLMATAEDLSLESEGSGTANRRFLAAQIGFVVAEPRGCADSDLASPILRGIRDITVRERQLATPAQVSRHTAEFGYWLLGVLAGDDLPGVLSFSDTLRLRMFDAGTALMSAISNIVCPQPVPEDLWHHPGLVAACQASMLTAVCDNDLFSYGKERFLAESRGQRSPTNLVCHLEASGLDTAKAFETVVDYRNRAMCLWQHLRQELQATAAPALTAFLRAVDLSVTGNNQYHLTSSRYHNPDGHHSHAITFDTTFTTQCPVTDHSPPAASVAWWWEQLDSGFH